MGIVTAWHLPGEVDKGDIKAELLKMLAPFGGIGVFITAGDHVFLKPDVSVPALAEEGLVTDPLLVEAVIDLAFETGAASVTVGESADIGFDTINNFCLNGYDYFCQRSGAQLRDLKEGTTCLRDIPNALLIDYIKVYKQVLLADVVINLPKLKIIENRVLCGATRNLLGFVPDDEKARLKSSFLDRALFDLSTLITPDLTILDGININDSGREKRLNMLLVGMDMVAIDTIATAIMGLDPQQIEYLQLAEQYGLASAQPLNITIYGDDLSPLMKK
ncbi:MAG: DUF362 domain-containing protein [Bacillota bacterium]|jgi:uncharacterized protein (DUF362 family)